MVEDLEDNGHVLSSSLLLLLFLTHERNPTLCTYASGRPAVQWTSYVLNRYGMTLSTTNTALEELGLLDELRQRDTVSESHYVSCHIVSPGDASVGTWKGIVKSLCVPSKV